MSANQLLLTPLPGDITLERVVADVSAQISGNLPSHAAGYQGAVYISRQGDVRFAVKVAAESGFRGWLARRMLYREFRRYRRLRDCQGVPACFGLVDYRFLILEFVQGAPLRRAEPADREHFYARLFDLITDLHGRGIAHADLKRKDNLLVVNGSEPCLIDFGAAFVRRQGFAPLNHLSFRIAAQFDRNAWIKLKYRNRLEEMSDADRKHYRLTFVERLARWTRRPYRWLTRNAE